MPDWRRVSTHSAHTTGMHAHGETFSQAVELSLCTVTTRSGKNGRSRENTSMLLRFSVSAEIADDGLTLWLCQRWESAFVDKTIHSLQNLLPFLHRPESRIRHPMGHPMVSKGFAMAASATLREHPPIGSVQVRDSGKHPSTPDHPHQRQQSRDKSSYALGTPDVSHEASAMLIITLIHSRCRN